MYGIEYPNEDNIEESIMIDIKLKDIVSKTPNDTELGETLRKRITRADWDKMDKTFIGEKKVIDKVETDPIVDKVLLKFATRSKLGITKYGTTLQDNNASLFEWLNHLQEELMDATLYIEKLKQLNK
jgi:hypothetical protein